MPIPLEHGLPIIFIKTLAIDRFPRRDRADAVQEMICRFLEQPQPWATIEPAKAWGIVRSMAIAVVRTFYRTRWKTGPKIIFTDTLPDQVDPEDQDREPPDLSCASDRAIEMVMTDLTDHG